jgi:DNA-binding CsgD family transcriptional regulator
VSAEDDDPVIDIRSSLFSLTGDERAMLQTIVDRNVIDLPEIGRVLGASDEGVLSLMANVAEKLDTYRYLADNRTPPLGVRLSPTRARRRLAALRAERQRQSRDA